MWHHLLRNAQSAQMCLITFVDPTKLEQSTNGLSMIVICLGGTVTMIAVSRISKFFYIFYLI